MKTLPVVWPDVRVCDVNPTMGLPRLCRGVLCSRLHSPDGRWVEVAKLSLYLRNFWAFQRHA